MPRITTALGVPPPTAAFLDPDPFAALVGPVPAVDRCRLQQERVFLPVISDSFADDVAGIRYRLRRGKDLEVGRGKIAERVEIVHLAVDEKEGMLGPITKRGGAYDHAGSILALAIHAVGGAHRPAKSPEVGNGVAQLCFRAREREKESE